MGNIVLLVDNLSKSYNTEVFSKLSFSISEKESLGIVGGNGKGKTTLLNIIAGLEKPTSGTVSLSAKVGYVMQRGGYVERLSLRDNLRFFAELHGLQKQEAKDRIEFCVEVCRLSGELNKRADKCSYGWTKRLSVAIALLSSPRLLLLDEAASGLDTQSKEDFSQILHRLKSDGCSLVMVSHYKAEISEFCEKILDIEASSGMII
jgi:ABC-type multidrug transport system ATPase subunit